MAPRTLLFIRGMESIWIERLEQGSLLIAGPGASRKRRKFSNDAALNVGQAALADRLAAHGWFVWAIDQDRRSGRERRGAARATQDRRRTIKQRMGQ
jgi:hypothetical protein